MNHEESWQEFLDLILKCDNKEDLYKLFDIFLTLSEKEAIANRYAIINKLLTNPDTHRNLAKNLSVSLANITRGANLLKLRKLDIEQLFNKLNF